MEESVKVDHGSLFVRTKAGTGDGVYWDAQWRYRVNGGAWKQKTRRLGFQEQVLGNTHTGNRTRDE
jgi:hypothetical protein